MQVKHLGNPNPNSLRFIEAVSDLHPGSESETLNGAPGVGFPFFGPYL